MASHGITTWFTTEPVDRITYYFRKLCGTSFRYPNYCHAILLNTESREDRICTLCNSEKQLNIFYLSAVVMVHTEFQGRNGYYRFLTTVQTRDSCHFHSVQEMHTYTCTIFTYYFSLPRLNNNGQFTWGDNMGGIMYNKLILF